MSMTAMGIGLTQTAGKPDGSGGFIPIPGPEVAQYTQAPLGFTHLEPASSQMSKPSTDIAHQSGDREWIYIWNASGADLTPGTVCIRGAAPLYVGPAPAVMHPSMVVGVVQHTIPDGFCGFILRKGVGQVTLSAATAVGDGIEISGVGTAGPTTALTEAAFGSCPVATAAPGLGTVNLNCVG